jgi:long-chain acyl-CoA synthetase
MAGEDNVNDGIPLEGAFDTSENRDCRGAPLGTHRDGNWRVDRSINQTVTTDSGGPRVFRQRPETYDAMIRHSAARHPENEAVICGDRRIIWADFDAMIERTACGYLAAGLLPGERVAVMLDNRLEYLVAILACIRAGGIAVPLGTRLGVADVAHIVGDSRPEIAVIAHSMLNKFKCSDRPRRIYLIDGDAGSADNFARLTEAEPARDLPRLRADDVMMIVYTSGTTGKPKGACLTHANFVHTCLHYLYALAIDRPLRSLLAIPASHIAGFGPLASVTLASGGTIVMIPQFHAERVFELMSRERVTYAVLVPSMYQLLAMKVPIEDFDLTSWKYGVYGGAIMPPATIERFSKFLPDLRMINAYGATETCAVCSIMPPELTRDAPASVGLPLECDDILIIGENAVPVSDGKSGEIWIRGPNVSPGYWNNPEASAKEFQRGFWKSGDVGYRDERGLIFVNDRLKDMINRGGFKVFSAEVENALMTHPRVDDCAVVGVPDKVLGEKTFAQVSSGDGTLTADALRHYLLERIADYKVPDFWLVQREPVLRNQNGKIQKHEIRKIAQDLVADASRQPTRVHKNDRERDAEEKT